MYNVNMNVMKNAEIFLKTQAYFLRFGGDGVRDLNSKIEDS